MRASTLLTQFFSPRVIERARFGSGCWLVFWGLWKKVVIADNMALLADPVFAASATTTWFAAYLGVVAFAFQIYADFSAYSDIARGVARLMGFELPQNFDLPYFAVSPSDFWRRWHISLSTWLRDYLYVPLGGSRGTPVQTYRNLFITMLLGGLWHGAAWNYAWWGVYHGILLIAQRLGGRRDESPTGWRLGASVIVMFQFTLLWWLLFRCTRRVMVNGRLRDDSFAQIVEMLGSFRNGWGFDATSLSLLTSIAAFGVPLLLVQWAQWRARNQFVVFDMPTPARVAIVSALTVVWLVWGVQSGDAFIYFQF